MMKHNSMLLHRMVLMLYDSSEMGIREEIKSNQDEEVVCNSIARECIDFAENYFPGLKIAFSTTLPDDFSIRSNSLYLLRSLREILYNSGKYSDGQHVSLQLSATKDTVRFAFQDTGSGIADNYKEYIFKPFTKVNDLSEGLGLGLPLSKQHVVRMGGTLTYDDTYREGCRIIIEMPRK
jgi:signal transduction histidine kinase